MNFIVVSCFGLYELEYHILTPLFLPLPTFQHFWASGYPLNVNGGEILTSEALYQACRFPHLPNIQQQIIAERSPMTAKMKTKPYRDQSRPDWDKVRIEVMRWCLQVKLIQNWDKFSALLLATDERPIVEDSHKDDFWGAKPRDDDTLIGINALGHLLMELREQIKKEEITSQTIVYPPDIGDFLLYGQPINPVSKHGEYCSVDGHKLAQQEVTLLHLQVNSANSALTTVNAPTSTTHPDNHNQKNLIVKSHEFDKYDSLQFILPHLVESLQEVPRNEKELAQLFKTNLSQMRDWLKRAVQLGKIKKLSRPVRYVAESQLFLIN
ncbi:NADAR family protein [Gloeomargaritales cyanobacterium VI4D9]|nr:NADAR family protein [Gloeomargaritales cyanobacterium VI4D9]